MGAASLFFGGTMGDNLSAFGQYNLTNVPSANSATPANPFTNTALSGHLTWSFSPGVNLSFGNGFTDWTFGNAIGTYTTVFPSLGTGVEFSLIRGNTGGFKLTGGLAQAGTTAGVNKLDDLRYVRAKYKFGGAGLLSGAGGTYGNEYVGLDNHFALGAEYVNASKSAFITASTFTGASSFYGVDMSGSIGNFYAGAAYSASNDIDYDNYRVECGYFVYPWLKTTLDYRNLRSGDATRNDPTVALGATIHLRSNAYITATYTAHSKDRITPTSNSTQDTFAVQAGFAF
jgi:hypothetical protein